MDKSTYEKIARLFDLVAEMNVLTLSLRQAKVAVEFGSSGASRADPLGERSVAVVRIQLETEAKPLNR